MRRILIGLLLANCVSAGLCDDGLRERLKDANGTQTETWVYNNIGRAMETARTQNKPLFVTFRCVPCKNCAAFDADVANGNERVRAMARDQFVSVRQVEMKGVDLSLFQFDYDLSWAAIFLNADGVIYARYGTQSAEGADAYNSVDGLIVTMQRVLDLHKNYPANVEELKAKRASNAPAKTALELPGLRNLEKYARQTERSNCIHCHNIHDAQYQDALNRGTYTRELLWKYPLPENLGLTMDRREGVRITAVRPGTAAAKAGMKPGEEIVRMNGQRIASIADLQWVLHHLPGAEAQVEIETVPSGAYTLALGNGWRKTDISWRGSLWNAPPRFGVWAPRLPPDKQTALKLPENVTPLEVRWIDLNGASGRSAHESGLREKDVIIEIAGRPVSMNPQELNVHLKLNYEVGQFLPLTILRDGQRKALRIPLVE